MVLKIQQSYRSRQRHDFCVGDRHAQDCEGAANQTNTLSQLSKGVEE
jgi:hypothetical protein